MTNMTVNYKGMVKAVAGMKDFRHSSCKGAWVDTMPTSEYPLSVPDTALLKAWLDEYGSVYVVWSYNTVIAYAIPGHSRVPDRKYSSTTSKHQNICRKYL